MLLFCVQEDGQPFPSLYFLVQGKDFLFFLKLLSSLQKPPLLGEGGSQWILQLQTGDPVGFRVQSVAFSRLFLQKPGSETLGLQDLMVRPGLAWRWEVPRKLSPFSSCPPLHAGL